MAKEQHETAVAVDRLGVLGMWLGMRQAKGTARIPCAAHVPIYIARR